MIGGFSMFHTILRRIVLIGALGTAFTLMTKDTDPFRGSGFNRI